MMPEICYNNSMNEKTKFVCGVGINDYPSRIYVAGKCISSYNSWNHMLNRCYSPKLHSERKTYAECIVCDAWKYFSNFKQWYDENYVEGFQLDKDILVEGNKVYSPETCRFVPQYLNTLLTDRENSRGSLPIGVCERKPSNKTGQVKSTYQSFCNNGYGKLLNKTFKTIEEASAWYSETKKRIVKEQATRAFLDNAIKTDVYIALIRRTF